MSRGNKLLIKCDNASCEKEIERIPSLITPFKHHFCSVKCKSEWQSQNFVGRNNPHYGKHLTEEAKRKISKTKTGKPTGRVKLIDITKQELRNLYWTEELTLDAIADSLGICRPTLRNWMRRWEIPTRPAHGPRLEKSKRKISKANKGRLNGKNNPSKRPEVREKISKGLMGRKISDKHRAILSKSTKKRKGKLSPRYGQHLSEESKEKIRNSDYHRNCKGVASPNWRGGYGHYFGPDWREQRRSTRKRDNHTCRLCGKTKKEIGRELDVHHLIPFREFGLVNYAKANQLSNLIALCRPCHIKTENGKVTTRDV